MTDLAVIAQEMTVDTGHVVTVSIVLEATVDIDRARTADTDLAGTIIITGRGIREMVTSITIAPGTTDTITTIARVIIATTATATTGRAIIVRDTIHTTIARAITVQDIMRRAITHRAIPITRATGSADTIYSTTTAA